MRAKARRQAIADAKRKAEVLADDLGVSIVRVAGFFESGRDVGRPIYVKMKMVADAMHRPFGIFSLGRM